MTIRLLALLWLLGFLVSCGPAAKRGDLVFINGAEPETLDPGLITGQPEGRIVNALFEGLTTFNSEARPGPGMAESWTISDDKRIYTFKLRPGIAWSDGTPITAQVFVDSWRRTLLPDTAASYNYQLFYVKNAQAFAEGRIAWDDGTPMTAQDFIDSWRSAPLPDAAAGYNSQLFYVKTAQAFANGKFTDFAHVGVKALDDRTLEVTLENPTPFFLDLCATPPLAPVPTKVIEKYGDDWIKPEHMVNNGAYVVETWRINDIIRLRKNPHYWNAANVALETIDVLPISKDTVAYNFFASGLADLSMDKGLTPPALLDALKKRPEFHPAPFLGTYFLRFNCKKGPFTDDKVRRAFGMAIDKRRIVEKITRAGELPATAFVPPGLEGYASPDGLPYDPEKARALLAEAGYPDGKGFPLVNYLYDDKGSNEFIAVELQDMWKKELGVGVNLAKQEWKVYLNSMSSLDYDIARSSWVGDYPDPNTFLDMFLTGGGNNRTGWSDPAYDRLIAEAAAEIDPAKRFGILKDAQNLLVAEQAPI
ncbi:MAG TPA: peptide ABC transporter substrate-binding protein, partial [Chthoniobacteraceae bacterium]|nr:peptide ABC transporter substrate-binding protein [Chthoniobacteraceae bacterium]